MPGTRILHAIYQDDRQPARVGKPGNPGFVFAPFHAGAHPAILLRPDDSCSVLRTPRPASLEQRDPISDREAREIHMNLVSEAVRTIRESDLVKVVLARRFSVPFSGSSTEVFDRLCDSYPGAFCYLWSHPQTGTWMGATPESLMEYEDGTGSTTALAGTLKASGTTPPEWTTKEYNEQRLVTDFISQRIRNAGLDMDIGPTRDARAGSLWHLQNRIEFRASADQAASLIGELHPTPAVCGLPVDTAKAYILKNENFDREYYTGYLGEVGLSGTGSFRLFVNLRCMQIRGQIAHIYVGGGITANSDPAAEWEEIQQKSLTVLRTIQI